MSPPFHKSVFVNCPFDEDYSAILQIVVFCIVYLGLFPRLAPENADNAEPRLERILSLIKESKFGIHDLSRSKSTGADQFARMNMPFELGLDYGCRKFGGGKLAKKAILVLEERRYDYQKALSDISGWDIRAHEADHKKALRHVRDWLVAKAGVADIGPSKIEGEYIAFQEWHWERQLGLGFSAEDIKEYPNTEMIKAMHEWMELGQPD